jgi:CRP-like cAMP-binding protein
MELFAYLQSFHPISERDFAELQSLLHSRTFVKGEDLVVPGQVQRDLYFVKSGVQFSYFDTVHKTHVIAFTYPPNPCAVPGSFSLQQPSAYSVTCLTDSEMDAVSYVDLQRLFDRNPAIERLFRKITEHILAGMIHRHMELHALTIEERFREFCKRSPHLLQLVPHKYIASYLGMNPTNFSKLFNAVAF